MKKTISFAATIILFSAVAGAQQVYSPSTNPTVTAITAKYSLIETNHAPLTDEQIFPILGNYQYTDANNVSGTLHITRDADNKGIVWIEGLPQGNVKAFLRVSPATYKIPAQKTEQGNDVAEGVVSYDQDAKKLSLCVGCLFNQSNPQSAFDQSEVNKVISSLAVSTNDQKTTKSKSKTKGKKETAAKEEKKVQPWIITATKMEAGDMK